MARLMLSLLGCFQVTINGQPVNGNIPDKGLALLAFLALEKEKPHRREALAEMLWPDRPHPIGLTNLRQTLHRLRQFLGEPGAVFPVLDVSPHDIMFTSSGNGDCWLDTTEFKSLLGTTQIWHHGDLSLCPDCLPHKQEAASLYKGDLLEGFSLPDSPHFDWWLLAKIEEYHRLALALFDKLAIYFLKTGDYITSSRYAQRAIELEPWRERSHRMKMRALAVGGNPAAAIRQYGVCKKILAVELGIEPSKITKDVLEQIRQSHVDSQTNFEDEYRLL